MQYHRKLNKIKKNLTEESGKYCCDTISISCIVLSVSWTFREMSAASFFRVSRVVMTESSSRIWPLESFRTCNRFFSSCRNLSWNSPKQVKKEYEYQTSSESDYKSKLIKGITKIFLTQLEFLPCSFSKFDLLSSMSGRSAFSTWLRHCDWREDLVTVKFTNVTREQMSGGNSTVGSRVDRKMVKAGDKSIS